MEDNQVKLTVISSEKSLADIVTLSRQFGGELPTLEVIKLAKVLQLIIGIFFLTFFTARC